MNPQYIKWGIRLTSIAVGGAIGGPIGSPVAAVLADWITDGVIDGITDKAVETACMKGVEVIGSIVGAIIVKHAEQPCASDTSCKEV
jgi:hypothetical protein